MSTSNMQVVAPQNFSVSWYFVGNGVQQPFLSQMYPNGHISY